MEAKLLYNIVVAFAIHYLHSFISALTYACHHSSISLPKIRELEFQDKKNHQDHRFISRWGNKEGASLGGGKDVCPAVPARPGSSGGIK